MSRRSSTILVLEVRIQAPKNTNIGKVITAIKDSICSNPMFVSEEEDKINVKLTKRETTYA